MNSHRVAWRLGSAARCGSVLGAVLSNAYAMSTLPIPVASIQVINQKASRRFGSQVTLALTGCKEGADGGNICRYDVGAGVELLTAREASGIKPERIESSWNTANSDTSSSSADLFRNACRFIVAAVRPTWTANKVTAVAAKLVLSRATKGRSDFEGSERDLVFYGNRDTPEHPDVLGETIVTCGVRAR